MSFYSEENDVVHPLLLRWLSCNQLHLAQLAVTKPASKQALPFTWHQMLTQCTVLRLAEALRRDHPACGFPQGAQPGPWEDQDVQTLLKRAKENASESCDNLSKCHVRSLSLSL